MNSKLIGRAPPPPQPSARLARRLAGVGAVGISVTVNGSPVAFTGQGPVEQGGRVLVPLRGVLEKLGAYVSYDAAARQVSAVRGQTSIVLPIGGRPPRSAAAAFARRPRAGLQRRHPGALRFVAEALGERVAYEPASRTVAVVTSAPGPHKHHRQQRPPPVNGR
jgi:hypothetical protein